MTLAVDAGLIPEGEEVLSVAQTARGADTVLLIKSAASKRFFDLKVLAKFLPSQEVRLRNNNIWPGKLYNSFSLTNG